MDDLSRQATIDALFELDVSHWVSWEDAVIDLIDLLPSAQPEIIRCKECKFWQDQEEGVVEVPICARPQNKFEKHPMVMIIGADGFCSFGKRREDG